MNAVLLGLRSGSARERGTQASKHGAVRTDSGEAPRQTGKQRAHPAARKPKRAPVSTGKLASSSTRKGAGSRSS
jgi:hypothetical protein